MEIDWTEPKITDWISSIAALLGIPSIVYGIVRLFIKNKDQEKKLVALESLASSQSQQIEELAKQTSEYQHHSELMRESNELSRIRVELQNQNFLHNRVNDEQKAELQNKERRLAIKPHFILSSGSSSSPENFQIRLQNKGNMARNLKLEVTDDEPVKIKPLDPTRECNQNQGIEILGTADSAKTELNSNQVPFGLLVHYEDINGNRYTQRLTRRQQRTNISNPTLIEG